MTAEEYREYFREQRLGDIVEIAVNLAIDCDRLRKELDEANKVVR